jgi:8-oxo-dGTP pyrophosphatase MutT (NUDIX family)
MLKLLFRLFGRFLGRFIDTDRLSDSFPVSAKAVIREHNKVLLLLNERGQWDFPGGKLKMKSDIESTLIEEVKEETNLSVKIGPLIYLKKHLVYRTEVIVVIYKAENIGIEPIYISHEHFKYNFFELTEIEKMNVPEWVAKTLHSH